MLGGADTVADIGCDHGRLACALAQSGAARRVIASDISAPSLEKARRLVALTGLEGVVSLRLGDGFSPVAPGEADAACLLGMGGTLMARLLERCAVPFNGASRIVFQPMRAAEDIRLWLYTHGCRMLDDRIVRESGRLYQVFMAAPPSDRCDPLPQGWPADFWKLGYTAFAWRDPLFLEAVARMEAGSARRLRRGDSPALRLENERLAAIRAAWEESKCI